jgi:hypothetical protein
VIEKMLEHRSKLLNGTAVQGPRHVQAIQREAVFAINWRCWRLRI